jgi:GTP 3',8-cyclase
MIQLNCLQSGIVDHCNNHCACCSMCSPVSRPRYMSPETLREDLRAFSKIAHAGTFNVVGGEPLLHPNLLTILRYVKESSIADHLYIYTNGKLLRRMPEEFWTLFDGMHLSQYANQEPGISVYANEKCREHGINFGTAVHDKFYTVRTRHKLSRDEAIANSNDCPWRIECCAVRYGYFYRCSHSARYADVFYGLEESTQGVLIQGLSEAGLRKYLYDTEPLEMCYTCHTHHDQRPWKEIHNREEWLEDSFSNQ